MTAPCTAVPLPGGRPVPSGMAAISQAAISASVMGLPSFGVSAAIATEPNGRTSAAASKVLRVNMFDLPGAADAPAREAVVVLIGEPERVRHRFLGLAPRGHKVLPQRLRVAGLVPGAALQHGGLAVPAPWHVEARECLRMHRSRKPGGAPAFAAAGGTHTLG